jgi:hypothetical protein
VASQGQDSKALGLRVIRKSLTTDLSEITPLPEPLVPDLFKELLLLGHGAVNVNQQRLK